MKTVEEMGEGMEREIGESWGKLRGGKKLGEKLGRNFGRNVGKLGGELERKWWKNKEKTGRKNR